jgi:hypothetical protein
MKSVLFAALAAAVMLSSPAFAQASPAGGTLADVAPSSLPPAPAPTRTFGGCNKLGTFCAQPSGLITLTGYNITTKEVMATFQPGFGYGFTIHPEDWYAFGLDAFVALQPKTDAGPQRVSLSLVAKFANYLRVGIGRERVGDRSSWVIPIGFGIDVSL